MVNTEKRQQYCGKTDLLMDYLLIYIIFCGQIKWLKSGVISTSWYYLLSFSALHDARAVFLSVIF